MNTKYYFALLLFLVSAMLAGCTNGNLTTATIGSSVPIFTSTTITVSTPISTITPRPSSTVTLTRTPFSTLTHQQQEQMHENTVRLLETNGGCELPCWWGITPGETTWAEAEQILQDEGIYFDRPDDSMGGGFLDSFLAPDGMIQSSFGFGVRNSIVEYIGIESNTSVRDPSFRKIWANFAPERIIPVLGVPSRVELYTSYSPGEGSLTGARHSLYVFYDSQGVLLNYSMATRLRSVYTLCPTFGEGGNTEDSIGIILKSTADNTPIENYDYAYSNFLKDMVLSLEEAAGITPEDFYNLFLQTDVPICFDVPSTHRRK